ncbi:NACHT domain-containing NTPase [Bartonella sp. HY038]|uniref:NACHT domain-containing protein n=1 Tax=Bartonella sp. HY038 TaxID=2759660 RepID=UPI0015FD119F|nr:NACHT domain-containing protein [Bartonella sp. HY038]
MEVLTTFVAAGFAKAFKKLIESYVDQRVKQHFANPASIKTDFKPHLKATFDKCTKIKTVLDGTKPLNMLDIYAGQNFEIHKQHVDHYQLIERIKNINDAYDNNAYVLTGTGGGGKSMFMRYLWISLFEDPRGKIPFFLELRSFNKAKHSDLEDFIYQSVIKTGSTISKENFTNGLRAGNFYLLLDGFDEVTHDNRHELQAHIISLRENNPNVTLIISSRPDECFSGWNQFEIIKVLPLNEKQVRDLIKKAPFDKEKKTTFLNNLGSIYQTHESFLTTPLLAYMMLIAYADNQNLPDLMVDFYEQAFGALFERHDLMKNGYKRKLYCNLGRTEFKNLFLSFV